MDCELYPPFSFGLHNRVEQWRGQTLQGCTWQVQPDLVSSLQGGILKLDEELRGAERPQCHQQVSRPAATYRYYINCTEIRTEKVREDFTITEMVLTRTFSWLKAPTSAKPPILLTFALASQFHVYLLTAISAVIA